MVTNTQPLSVNFKHPDTGEIVQVTGITAEKAIELKNLEKIAQALERLVK